MSSIQIVGNCWTGRGGTRRLAIETRGDRIGTAAPAVECPSRPDAIVLPDSALIIPGLHDAHAHLMLGGLKLGECNFDGVASREQFADTLADYLERYAHEKGNWIRGTGLDETQVSVSRHDLDHICSTKPVFIWSHDLHTAFVNSRALEKAGIGRDTIDPPDGRFERDSAGELTGVLREGAAHVAARTIPPISAVEARAALIQAQAYAFSLGLTAISSSVRSDYLPHYLDFASSSDRKIRINAWRVSDHFSFEEDRFERCGNAGFRHATLKGFADGALGSRSAAFWQPYSDLPESSGMPLVREGPLARWIRAAHGEGHQIAIHAIGDRANSICLDALEMAGSAGRGPEFRPRIEHAQHLRERDIQRFTELGVIASMQPIHCTADMRFIESRLGFERSKHSYAWRSLLNAGVPLAFGSDWPVEDLNPMAGIHAAITRQDRNGKPPQGWQPQERITVEDALRAYTTGSAYAGFWECDLGTIEVGKFADLTILSSDVLSIQSSEIATVKVRMTVVGGEIVYQG